MKKSLTIEDLKEKIGKPVFIASPIYLEIKKWNVIKEIAERQDLLYKYLEFIDGLTVTFDKVNVFRFFDEEVTEEELKEILVAEKKEKKKTGYETVEESKSYFYINEELEISVEHAYINGNCIDSKRIENGNHFNDEKLTENIARAERLRYQLRRFAALNGSIPSQEDWGNKRIDKYYICYDYDDNKIDVHGASFIKEFGQIYFKSEEAREKAIEIFKDELLWYFTEFKEMLY